jgi:hypothetical protein
MTYSKKAVSKCDFPGCDEKAVRGFHAYRELENLNRGGILPISTMRWCGEHESSLAEHLRFPGTFFDVS